MLALRQCVAATSFRALSCPSSIRRWLPVLLTSWALLCLPLPGRAEDEVEGDVSLLAGGAWPQGSTLRFSDPGWTLSLRVAGHIPSIAGVIPTLSLGGTFFPTHSQLVDDETESFIVVAKQRRDWWAGSLNVGLQLGSPSRRGFFRPRAGIAPGFYLLSEETTRTLPEDLDPYYESSLLFGRLGWKGTIGADLFVTPKVGIALDFVYDQIWHLENGQSGRYQGFAVGVAFAFDSGDLGSEPQDDSESDDDPYSDEEAE